MTTARLHYDDSLLLEFDARVVAHDRREGRSTVILDRSAFYPESGGQMSDHGTLGGARVVDVQIGEDARVHHVVEGDPPGIDVSVHGTVDGRRRRLHMALHTGQHVLSRALVDELRAETVSSRLGSVCTIDVDRANLSEADIARAEALTNSIVDDDVRVRALWPDPDELADLPLRRAPKVEGPVRVVQIGDFDVAPCGGTHCTSSSQIGLVRVVGVERYKGGTRVSFQAGPRAREVLVGESDVLRGLGRELTCGPGDVPSALDKLRRELAAARESLGEARARAATSAAGDLARTARAAGTTRVLAEIEGGSVEVVRAVAARLAEEPDLDALLATRTDDGVHVVFMRGAESALDCGGLLRKVAAEAGGRGGGRPERAEGRLPAGASFVALVESALAGAG